MEIFYSSRAAKQLKTIARGDRKSALLIIKGIENYSRNPSGHPDVKLLKGRFGQFKRLRVGNYRVIFDDNNRIMHIYEIKHRQGAYND